MAMNTSCELWSGTKDKDGYGVARLTRGRKVPAHRKVWIEANGPIPAGMVVMHRCDTPSCVRLSHLRLGTQQENVADSIGKGRWMSKKRRDGYAKWRTLTDVDVSSIRNLFAQGVTQVSIANQYGIDPSTVSKIVNNQRRAV